ncbi:glycosyltransferase family protein [Chitinimonas koreensis]|uniref:glycosyltransferase family protein n=1 Tax=Chitinimonas koreensis TaxID=356302 RepID=UPI0003F8544B|nr:glycosyltransferase [Chitinimonas koreensis]QNM96196.1 hypothetical protein H9L41_20690 [Chitinimonas koreensis]
MNATETRLDGYEGVYFYFHERALTPFAHCAEALASGLARLGVPVYSNLVVPALFQTRSVHERGPWLYVFVLTNEQCGPDYLRLVEQFDGPRLILSMSDANNTIFPPAGVPALMTHESRWLQMAGRRIPWAFGLSPQVEALTAEVPPFEAREAVILRNFRPSLRQGVRNALDLALLPHLKARYRVDETLSSDNAPAVKHHHHHDYFERLKHSFGCLAYGGEFFSNLLKHKEFRDPRHEAIFSHYTFVHDPVILRWDSWRLWESLAAGCLTFMLDVEQYGFALPVAPQPWRHYVPVDFARPAECVERLADEPALAAAIAAAGREWVRAEYGCEAVARRFLGVVAELRGVGELASA